jgi:hypothetical protein
MVQVGAHNRHAIIFSGTAHTPSVHPLQWHRAYTMRLSPRSAAGTRASMPATQASQDPVSQSGCRRHSVVTFLCCNALPRAGHDSAGSFLRILERLERRELPEGLVREPCRRHFAPPVVVALPRDIDLKRLDLRRRSLRAHVLRAVIRVSAPSLESSGHSIPLNTGSGLPSVFTL